MAWQQGKYQCAHPEKYVGDLDEITFRSSWELYMNRFLDGNPNVLLWSSEPVAIPYLCPVAHPQGLPKPFFKQRNYYPDYWMRIRNRKGVIVEYLVEIKPKAQTMPSKSRNRKRQLAENYVVAVNMAKWAAAKAVCAQKGISFIVLTEDELFTTFK